MASELEHQHTLDATLRAVVALLDKQALVHQLVARTDTRKHALVQSLVQRQHAVELEKKLNQLHPADAAFVLESLRQEQRMTAWQLIARERRGAVLLELADSVRASLVTLLDESELIGLGRQMEAEDFADLVQDLPKERVDAVLAQLGSAERAEVQSVLSFPEGSVGALMQLDVVTVRADVTLEDAIASLRRRGSLPPQLTSVTVVDRNNVLQGTLPIDQLLVRDGALAVSEVMDAEPKYFLTSDREDQAAEAFERYDLIAAPVVNLHKQVVGMLTVDKVLEQIKQDSFKQALSQVGLSEDEDLFAPIWQSGRKRLAWLGLNLLTAFVASRVVGGFEDSIAQLTALAALDADRREHRRQHGQSDGGARDPRFGVVAVERAQHVFLVAQGARDRRDQRRAVGRRDGRGDVSAVPLARFGGRHGERDAAEHARGVGRRRALPADLGSPGPRSRHGQQHPADGDHRQHGVLHLLGARVAAAAASWTRGYDGNSTPEPPADFGRSLCFASESTMRSTASW